MNVVSWIAIIILLLSALNGLRRGLVSTVFAAFSFIVAIIIAVALSPNVSSYLMGTSFYDTVNSGVETALFSSQDSSTQSGSSVSGSSSGILGSGTQSSASQGSILGSSAQSSSILGSSAQSSAVQDLENGLAADQGAQSEVISSLPLPEYIKDALSDNNNADIYESLGVNAFQGYVSTYIARMIVSGLSFILVFLAAFVILKIIGFALDLASRLPVLGALNRIGGLIFGLINGVFILWLICSAATLLGGTELAGYIYSGINGSRMLSFIYNNNFLLDLLANIRNIAKL